MNATSCDLAQANPIIRQNNDNPPTPIILSKTDSLRPRKNSKERIEFVKNFVVIPASRTTSILYYECLIGVEKYWVEREFKRKGL